MNVDRIRLQFTRVRDSWYVLAMFSFEGEDLGQTVPVLAHSTLNETIAEAHEILDDLQKRLGEKQS